MEGTAAAVVSVLPDDVLPGILRRLPARSLAASRRVCKAWQTIIDEEQLLLRLRRLLPHAVTGLFMNFIDHDRPHFFARPTSTPGPRIDGEFSFIERRDAEPWNYWYRVQDHCNGLVLRSADDFSDDNMYVINPATQKWDHLPPCDWNYRAFIVFDPAVSPHYEVLMMEPSEEEVTMMPPSSWRWHVLSSTTMRWEERVFVREGEAAEESESLPEEDSGYDRYDTRWRFAAYWQGALYVHCRGEFISRLSLSNDTYTVMKSPIDLAECNEGVRSFIGKSVGGVYFAALDNKARLRVWTLSESADKRTIEWLLKHQSALNPFAWSMKIRENDDPQQRTYTGPWNMDVRRDKQQCLL
ncbi:hypothetical protein PR202_gb13668 [Eleusine coracana subsp. coracana]|uniref:F-box domain-containing protein n=1 Tax=Eleusine coracana subsp. coracana TaxID=191504 RepID=A0AAV5ER53_ELECO|nr:hypothetical protein PR202_gb13668 [Eleusine coracana subsp. coracana]